MKKKLHGIRRQALELDFDLYRVNVPIPSEPPAHLSVIDMHPQAVDRTLVFVHGYAGCAETWEYQINHFARNYRVVAPDLRGHGQSDAPFTRYTMNELVDDLHTIINTLKLPEKIILVGHSFGGSICAEYANAHPERLEKLILIATAGEYPLPPITTLVYKLPSIFYRIWWPYRPRWNAEVHVMKRMMYNNLRSWKGWNVLQNIKTHTLMITGEHDTYFPREVFERATEIVPNAEIHDVGSAKHKVQLERHQAVNRAIQRFVDERRRGSWRFQETKDEIHRQRPWLNSYSKRTPHTIPIPKQPLDKFLQSAADWRPDRMALQFNTFTLTYKQLNERVNQFAQLLLEKGVTPGVRVFIAMDNHPILIIAYYATLRLGGVVVLPNADADTQAVIRQLEQTGSRILITHEHAERLIDAAKECTNLQHILFDTEASHLTYAKSPVDVEVSAQAHAAILFTSGTIHPPRGVCLSHRNLAANALQTRHWVPELRYGQETFLCVLPLCHSYGMTGAMNVPIMLGATMILLPRFEIDDVLTSIKRYKPTVFPGVPAMYTAINYAPNARSYGLSSIQVCISGAAPLPLEVQEEFEKITRGRLVEGYGLTEASPITHAHPLHTSHKPGSIGVPLPNTDARIVDPDSGETLEPHQIGELAVRGPQVMMGYCESDASGANTRLENDWLYTGDLAAMDEDGYFTIIGRKADVIMLGDQVVYPRDVEEILYEHSKIKEAAVVGTGSAATGQEVTAFVVAEPGAELSERKLRDFCIRRLEAYEVPTTFVFLDALPKTITGKVQRRFLQTDDIT